MTMTLTYTTYLKLPELLNLQQLQSSPGEHDEMLFIIIHQTYELWFKQLLHEFEKINRNFDANDMYGAIATFQRCRTIMKTLVGQLDILETMTPMSFASFRNRLDTSSGFQSSQFREFEFMLGYKRPQVLKYHHGAGTPGYEILQKRLHEPSIVDHFYRYLMHNGVAIPKELIERDLTEANAANEQVQQALLELYNTRPDMVILFELMLDFDEGHQEWRYRHVKLVERTIGAKMGTGGSPGIEFLKKSLFQPVFADLWEIRKQM
jgi:tryptophan 2,3-dioxygenase